MYLFTILSFKLSAEPCFSGFSAALGDKNMLVPEVQQPSADPGGDTGNYYEPCNVDEEFFKSRHDAEIMEEVQYVLKCSQYILVNSCYRTMMHKYIMKNCAYPAGRLLKS
jgi:hypothetical protein